MSDVGLKTKNAGTGRSQSRRLCAQHNAVYAGMLIIFKPDMSCMTRITWLL